MLSGKISTIKYERDYIKKRRWINVAWNIFNISQCSSFTIL